MEPNELMFEFDFTGVKDLKKHVESIGVQAGFYHAVVSKVAAETITTAKGPKKVLKFHFLIVAGTDPTQVNKTHIETLWRDDTEMSKQRQQFFALRLGLLSQESDAGKKSQGTWAAAETRSVVIQIHEEQYEGKTPGKMETKLTMTRRGLWKIDDPEVAACPKDPVVLSSSGIVLPIVENPQPLPGVKKANADQEPATNGSAATPGAPATPPGAGRWSDV